MKVINIAAYHFTHIADPDAIAERLHSRAVEAGLLGTVLMAPEGLNIFLAGAAEGIDAFLSPLRDDPRFAGMPVKTSRSRHQPFVRLKVKVKPEIIAWRRADGAPLAHPRAPTVAPVDLARWIECGVDDDGRPVVLLDTRNREEFAYGSFRNSLTLPIDNFTDLVGALAPHREALAGATVVSFCTGGIRCEKAALTLRAEGMDNVLQLDGGILGYFEQVGGAGYEGRCFVFDERVALDPSLQPLVDRDPLQPAA
ncbi:sulfurtransferase [Lysobacter sp. H21R4]|uniref:sulfurtransferase n=1 Tax=Lysobacter sp. H21R4 TaxID=2781021 RepID=UPI0018885FBC|nr:sulfurtransferase [Lysobacter sp. H21R4]QOY61746.1 sulfurtransferase [Lysobacter sp. H21R4]